MKQPMNELYVIQFFHLIFIIEFLFMDLEITFACPKVTWPTILFSMI